MLKKFEDKIMLNKVDRYESEIVDKLWLLEKEGKGHVKELATVEVNGKRLPFVAFTTGSEIVVTARHHINEFWGTTETVMQLAESGTEGLTLVPVVDVKHYAESEKTKDNFLKAEKDWRSAFMYDMYFGYKGGPKTHAKNQWHDYKYDGSSPEYIEAIKGLIDSSKVFIDVHNSAVREFFFLTAFYGGQTIPDSFHNLAKQVEVKGQKISNSVPGRSYKKTIYPGVYEYLGQGTAINFAQSKNKLNLGIEIPVFDHGSCYPGGLSDLSKIDHVAGLTAGIITGIKNRINE